ncbi:hypothetical protein RND81_03G191900 [Saponaria officinalis]|uniref:SHSP domain-containing protein n=1 Tax=Saponaria officinalis TaxID=3572 RepID=A0AAW1M1G3_SAPOF
MEAITEKMGRVGMNGDGDDRRGAPKHENGETVEEEGKMMNKNGKKNEKTMLRTPADIFEYPSFYSFVLDMPGLHAQHIKVKVENGILHVTGKRKKQQTTNNDDEGVVKVIRIERRKARYMRKFSLPQDAAHEHVNATYKDGVLSITVSKKLSFDNSTQPSFTNVNIS